MRDELLLTDEVIQEYLNEWRRADTCYWDVVDMINDLLKAQLTKAKLQIKEGKGNDAIC